jgi:SEC-C motif
MTTGTMRSVDEGGPFLVEAPVVDPGGSPCGHGVLVETRFDPASDVVAEAITLLLRPAERGERISVRAHGEPVTVMLSLVTGRCAPVGEEAERLLEEHAWLDLALAERLAWLRDRARRAAAQRDRETSCRSALRRAKPGAMMPYDELFPADWDLVLYEDGVLYWAVDHHCLKLACSCAAIVVDFHRIDGTHPRAVGKVTLDLHDPDGPPRASTPLTRKLFDKLWARRREELVRRHEEVRRQVLRVASDRPTVAPPTELRTPARNAPCPCGSGKKYKRCCASREAAQLAGAGPARRAQG